MGREGKGRGKKGIGRKGKGEGIRREGRKGKGFPPLSEILNTPLLFWLLD